MLYGFFGLGCCRRRDLRIHRACGWGKEVIESITSIFLGGLGVYISIIYIYGGTAANWGDP